MFRELQKENKIYKDQVLEQGKVIGALRQQITNLLMVVHGNGPTT
jgi:hypothetical protein